MILTRQSVMKLLFLVSAAALSAGTLSGAEMPDKWWLKNAQETTSLDKIVWHSEGIASYSNMSGKTDSSSSAIDTANWGRRGILTNKLSLIYLRQKTETSGVETVTEDMLLQDKLTADFTKLFFGNISLAYGQQENSGIEKLIRYRAALGLSFSPAESFDGRFDAGYMTEKETPIGGSSQDTNYMTTSLELSYSGKAYTATQDFGYDVDLDDSDSYKWNSVTGFDMPLSGKLSLTATYEIRYDNNPAGLATDPTIDKRESIQSLGLKFSF